MDTSDKLRMQRIEQTLVQVLARLGEIRDLLAAPPQPKVPRGPKAPPAKD